MQVRTAGVGSVADAIRVGGLADIKAQRLQVRGCNPTLPAVCIGRAAQNFADVLCGV